MPKMQRRKRPNEMPAGFLSAGRLLHGQSLAIDNATRMTGQVCHQVMSMNKAWLNLWSTLIMDFATLPRRFTSAQLDYIGNVLGSFEETGREMGKLVLHAEAEAGDTLKRNIDEAGEAQEQAVHALQSRVNSKRQKDGSGKVRRAGQSQQDQTH